MAQASGVSAGQRYIKSYSLTREHTEWRVVDIKAVGLAPPHAQLVNCNDPSDLRTVSCAELAEGGDFDLAEGSREEPAHARLDSLVRGGTGGGARVDRMLRQITLAVRRFKRSCARVPMKGKAVMAAARELRRTI
jgi:thiamine pyrophosphokinase